MDGISRLKYQLRLLRVISRSLRSGNPLAINEHLSAHGVGILPTRLLGVEQAGKHRHCPETLLAVAPSADLAHDHRRTHTPLHRIVLQGKLRKLQEGVHLRLKLNKAEDGDERRHRLYKLHA